MEGERPDRMEAGLGDLLFSLMNLGRFIAVNPEEALRKMIARFIARFQYIEEALALRGRYLDEEEVLQALGAQLDLPVRRELNADDVDLELLERLPIAFAKANFVLPLRRTQEGALRVATASPLDTTVFDDLRLLFDVDVVLTELVPRRLILSLINQVYDRGVGSIDGIVEEASVDFHALASEISAEPQDLLEAQDDAPIIRLVDSLLQQAVKERASDIHVEPFEKEIRVRFRIDDVLYEPMRPLPRRLQASVASRIKINGKSHC